MPQLAGWSLPSDAPVRAATEAKRNERSTAMMYKGGAANLPGELENWGQGRTEGSVHFYAGKCTLTPIFRLLYAQWDNSYAGLSQKRPNQGLGD